MKSEIFNRNHTHTKMSVQKVCNKWIKQGRTYYMILTIVMSPQDDCDLYVIHKLQRS